jgi:hypothetical protein
MTKSDCFVHLHRSRNGTLGLRFLLLKIIEERSAFARSFHLTSSECSIHIYRSRNGILFLRFFLLNLLKNMRKKDEKRLSIHHHTFTRSHAWEQTLSDLVTHGTRELFAKHFLRLFLRLLREERNFFLRFLEELAKFADPLANVPVSHPGALVRDETLESLRFFPNRFQEFVAALRVDW